MNNHSKKLTINKSNTSLEMVPRLDYPLRKILVSQGWALSKKTLLSSDPSLRTVTSSIIVQSLECIKFRTILRWAIIWIILVKCVKGKIVACIVLMHLLLNKTLQRHWLRRLPKSKELSKFPKVLWGLFILLTRLKLKRQRQISSRFKKKSSNSILSSRGLLLLTILIKSQIL